MIDPEARDRLAALARLLVRTAQLSPEGARMLAAVCDDEHREWDTDPDHMFCDCPRGGHPA